MLANVARGATDECAAGVEDVGATPTAFIAVDSEVSQSGFRYPQVNAASLFQEMVMGKAKNHCTIVL